ncbi:MAG: hypothetical protein V3V49_13745 [Candidatus Krumholzibacteria bacterium]
MSHGMDDSVLVGRGQDIRTISRQTWEGHLSKVPEHGRTRLSFMSDEHHLIRNFVVRELPRLGEPIEPVHIAEGLGLPLGKTEAMLEELEKNLFFLVRNEWGAVSWAFPVTAEITGHHLVFSTGERLDAA